MNYLAYSLQTPEVITMTKPFTDEETKAQYGCCFTHGWLYYTV